MRRWTTATSIETVRDDLVVAKRWIPVHPTGDTPWATEWGTRRVDSAVQRLIEGEARWLLAARGARVVTIRHVDPTSGVLATDLAGLHTLRTFSHRPPAAAAVLTAVAATLADLHRRGLVHGNLAVDHILLGGEELLSPLLCSPAAEQWELGPAADVLAMADLAEHVGPTAGRHARRWRRVTAQLHRNADRLGARAVAKLFTELAGDRALRGAAARRRNGRR